MADETEKVIEFVREHVYLYDTQHSEYKNVAMKNERWKEIGEKLNQTGEAVRQKWKNLRDSYVKYLKSVKGTSGQQSIKKFQNWPWAGHLQFLHDTVSSRPTTSNVAESIETFHEDGSIDNGFNGTDVSEMLPPPRKRRKTKEISADVNAVIKYLKDKQENTVKNYDRVDNLFLSYADTFKKFSARTQATIKIEMAQMFGRAELHELDSLNSTVEVQHPSPWSQCSSNTSPWSDNTNCTQGNTSNEGDFTEMALPTNTSHSVGLVPSSTTVSTAKELYNSVMVLVDNTPE